ncbi:heterokaryon incompatibility protein-domain-containing protein, partial [Microdochium trichocladiopsis]
MRLLRSDTLEPVEFMPNQIPPYAILSHTWEDEEVSFEELMGHDKAWQNKAGWKKIVAFAEIASSDGYQYVWADTCCIDKKSSAELQEAINSMYKWYRDSQVCYAYLSDVMIGPPVEGRSAVEGVQGSAFREARWFRRGWTLQELLAPHHVVFFDQEWNQIGDKTTLLEYLEEITGIDERFLSSPAMVPEASVAERMSWMAGRQTTRDEDIAYCMLGIFGIHMPMLYGEGHTAFARLQEKIMKVNDDSTLLAW